MKLDDLQLGKPFSFEQQYPTEEACTRAADEFSSKHLGARRYNLNNGFSFQDGRDSELEKRFTYTGTAYLIYYEALEGGKPVKNLGQLRKLYDKLLQSGYRGLQCPYKDGGHDGRGGKTVRCLLQAPNTLDGEVFGLLGNPPFPHGSPVSDKHHGWQPRKIKGYLLVLAGLVAGLAFGPLRQALRKRRTQPGR